MIHLDIIKYILNPLLNWDDVTLLSSSHSLALLSLEKKHYSLVSITLAIRLNTITYIFDGISYKIQVADRFKEWFKDDERHRENKDLPAYIEDGGTMFWYTDGERHRTTRDENGLTLPACILDNGDKEWYKNGKQHRTDKDENGLTLPACIEFNGSKEWYKDDKRHRIDKDENGMTLPACIWDGSKEWYKDDQHHREDRDKNGRVLPAVITQEYWINGKRLV